MATPRHPKSILTAIFLGLCLAAPAGATYFELSTSNNGNLGGLSFRDGDIVQYDTEVDVSTLILSEDLFLSNEDVDAMHYLDNGNFVFSTSTSASLGGLSFSSGDLVEYDPSTDTATLLFSQTAFADGSGDIDGVHILDSGQIMLSTANTETLGLLTFRDGDVVIYDPGLGVATVFFSEDEFSNNENIDALALLDNGNLVLSTQGSATLAGVSFQSGDLVEWAPLTQVATIVFTESLFTGSGNIDAVSAPEPGSAALLGLGLVALGIRARVRRRVR